MWCAPQNYLHNALSLEKYLLVDYKKYPLLDYEKGHQLVDVSTE